MVAAGKGADPDEELVDGPGLPRRVEVARDGEVADET
jgi:hypothetical protein